VAKYLAEPYNRAPLRCALWRTFTEYQMQYDLCLMLY